MGEAKTFDELTDHALIMAILEDYTPLTKAEHEGVEYSTLTEQQKYQYETGFRTGQVLNQLDRIEQATILVSSNPYIKAWRKHYGQFEFFQYNMEAYYLGVAGLVDRLPILANQLCCLGLADKEAKMTPLVKRLKAVQRANIATSLEGFKTATERVKSMRNDVAHAQRFHEKALWHIAVLEFHVRNKTMNDPDGFLKMDLDWDVKQYRREKKEQLEASNDVLIPKLKELFDMLLSIYISKRKAPPERDANQ